MDSLVQEWFLNKLLFTEFFLVINTWLLSIYLTGRKGNKRSPRMYPTALGSTGGQAADAGPSWRSYPDPAAVARRSGPEEVSARLGNLALGTSELARAATPLGSAVDGERAVPMAAAVPAAGAGAAASGGAGRLAAALAPGAAPMAAGSAGVEAAGRSCHPSPQPSPFGILVMGEDFIVPSQGGR